MTDRAFDILMISHHRRSKVNLANRSLAMARYLVALGHHVTLLATADQDRTRVVDNEQDGVHIVEIPDLLWGSLRSGWDPWSAIHRLRYLLRDETRFDLVHLFESRPAIIHPTQVYRWTRTLPLIIDQVDLIGQGGIMEVMRPRWYRLLFGGVETFYERHFRARADGVTVICTALARFSRDLGLAEDAVHLIPVGVDLGLYPAVLNRPACRAKVGVPQEGKILLFAGVDANFDFPIVLDAFVRVLQRHPETRLMLTGRPNSAVLALASRRGLTDRIITTGYVPHSRFPTYLGCADVFLLPFPNTVYNVGRWPSKVCDYMASGRPIVSNPTGDIKSLFERYEVGLLAGVTADEFAAQILYLFDHPELIEILGRNARRVAETHYDWRVLIQGLETFYANVLSRAPRVGSFGDIT